LRSNHISYQKVRIGEISLNNRGKRIEVIFKHPEQEKDRDAEVLRELAIYFAKKIQTARVQGPKKT
jgi:hypothetical protein